MSISRLRDYLLLLIAVLSFAHCASQSEFERFLDHFPELEQGERQDLSGTCNPDSTDFYLIPLAEAKSFLRPLPRSIEGGYDYKWAAGKVILDGGGTAVVMAACDPDLPSPQPETFLYHFDGEGELSEQYHLTDEPDSRMQVIKVFYDQGGFITLLFDPLSRIVFRNTWRFEAAAGSFIPEMDRMEMSECFRQYPELDGHPSFIPPELLFDQEDVFSAFNCDFSGDGIPDEITILKGGDFHPMLVRISDGKGGVSDAWRNDYLIPSSEGESRLTGEIHCDAGKFTFQRLRERPFKTATYRFMFDEEIKAMVFHSVEIGDGNKESLIEQQDGQMMRSWKFQEY